MNIFNPLFGILNYCEYLKWADGIARHLFYIVRILCFNHYIQYVSSERANLSCSVSHCSTWSKWESGPPQATSLFITSHVFGKIVELLSQTAGIKLNRCDEWVLAPYSAIDCSQAVYSNLIRLSSHRYGTCVSWDNWEVVHTKKKTVLRGTLVVSVNVGDKLTFIISRFCQLRN